MSDGADRLRPDGIQQLAAGDEDDAGAA